jgi:alcohol dehydrogenase
MKAWRLERLGGTLRLEDIPIPEARAGDVIVKIEASILMSYLKAYVEGRLPIYSPPDAWFTPGGNGVGVVHAVGPEVYHVRPGQRVLISSHVVAHENVVAPAQFLLGITAAGPAAKALQADWRDGTLAEYARVPKSSVTPAEGLDAVSAPQLCVLSRFAVPYGGLVRGRLSAGETVVVTGATGAYGGAAVLLALALGARVIAAGRNARKLEALARAGGPRVETVALTGSAEADAERLRAAAGDGADLAFDMVGNAQDPSATLSALKALRRGGRLVLMGSMASPLPIPYLDVMLNDLEILGQFMYPRDTLMRLSALARLGLLDIAAIRVHAFPMEALAEAMEVAAKADGLECVVVQPS